MVEDRDLTTVVLSGLGLAMGVATVVLLVLDTVTVDSAAMLLGLGLTALGMNTLRAE